MKARELKKILDGLSEESLEYELAIKVFGFYATEQHVKVKNAYDGFDWSHGLFVLVPEIPLTLKIEESERK
jgi:hypothetical protein